MAAAALLLMAACGSNNASATSGPADVAVKPTDLPKGMIQCDGSGTIDTFLNAVKTKDPTTYTSTKAEWDSAKTHGATSAYVVFYSDTKAHCATIQSSSNTDLGSANFPLVVNFVIQFKDEAAAATGYTTESIFGFSQATITSSATGVIKGVDTGLGKNSVVLIIAIASQSFYVADWQNKSYLVILGVINIDTTQSKKVATNVNGRIY